MKVYANNELFRSLLKITELVLCIDAGVEILEIVSAELGGDDAELSKANVGLKSSWYITPSTSQSKSTVSWKPMSSTNPE